MISSPILKKCAVAALMAGSLSFGTVLGEVVYDDTQGNLHSTHVSDVEYGDEITLGGTSRLASSFEFSYFSSYDLSSGAVFRLYKNDGAASPQGPASPGTLLYQSSPFNIVKSDASDPNNVVASKVTINLAGTGLVLPDTLTWTVEFEGTGNGNDAGLLAYDPPSVGSSFKDFWKNTSTGWQLFNFPTGEAGNFSAKVTANRSVSVPDNGSTLALFGFGLGGLFLVRRRTAA